MVGDRSTGGMQAVTLFQQLEAAGLQPDAKSYTALMKAFQEAGDLERAQRAYSAAAASGQANLVATNALVDVLVDAQRLQDAARVVQTLQRRVVKGGGDVQVCACMNDMHTMLRLGSAHIVWQAQACIGCDEIVLVCPVCWGRFFKKRAFESGQIWEVL